ncbi:acyl-protein thioesterase 1-like [Diadema setosum]|uniref:acyl-protein thioesterase 1-like n=1 Tax=Diadema setosum TaxID=31175 RepID=UPI003B3A57A7
MFSLSSPVTRLSLRLQSLVSLTSILVQPISCLHSSKTHPPLPGPTYNCQTPSAAGGVTDKGGSCPVGPHGHSTGPISSRYMCGNSYSSMASSNSAAVIPSGAHTATVIFLHGLGDQGHGWKEFFEMIKQPHIKYIFPHASIMPVTLNAGMQMPSWFDIFSLGAGGKEDDAGIKKASDMVKTMIEEEEKGGISSDRIVIGGFSQGGAVALYTALTVDKALAGVVSLSGWMPLHKTFKTDGVVKKSLPVLQCHGTADMVVPFTLGQMTQVFLQSQLDNLEFKKFDGLGHSSSDQEMSKVSEFLQKALP